MQLPEMIWPRCFRFLPMIFPNVAPDPQYADGHRATILERVGTAESIVLATEPIRKADVIPITMERTRQMRRIVKFAVAATILVALGILAAFLMIGGGSSNIAFARVAEALDSLKSATFDVTSETMGDKGKPPVTATGKGFFLEPSRQRVEMSADCAANMITISDGQAGRSIMLMPKAKLVVAMDMAKMRETMKKSANGAPPADLFETVRRLVREGSSGTGEKVERLGKKKIDGRETVGFRTGSNGTDMTVWADPQTARPVRIEFGMAMMGDVRVVMNRDPAGRGPNLPAVSRPANQPSRAFLCAMRCGCCTCRPRAAPAA
jgi:outer membrane lipoprotein-sorting protein